MPSAKTPHPHRHRRRATGLTLVATIIVSAAPAHALPTGFLGSGSVDQGGSLGADEGGSLGAAPGSSAPGTNDGLYT